MAVNEKKDEALETPREPGFYVGDNGPYESEEDAQAFIDGHLGGKGTVKEVKADA